MRTLKQIRINRICKEIMIRENDLLIKLQAIKESYELENISAKKALNWANKLIDIHEILEYRFRRVISLRENPKADIRENGYIYPDILDAFNITDNGIISIAEYFGREIY